MLLCIWTPSQETNGEGEAACERPIEAEEAELLRHDEGQDLQPDVPREPEHGLDL